MNLTDTHCHLDLEAFDNDRSTVIDQALETGVKRILIPALNGKSSRKVTSLSATHANLFAAIGCHPTEAGSWDDNSAARLKELFSESPGAPDNTSGRGNNSSMGKYLPSADFLINSQSKIKAVNKIVAIGEIGLDYYWDAAPHNLQRLVLTRQLELAQELNLPVILHSREMKDAIEGNCMDDLLGLLKNWVIDLHGENKIRAESPGVLHSFSGSLEAARAAIEMNFMIGVTGSITYRNADRRREIIAALPMDRLLIETDAPFQSPIPMRGNRNEPAFLTYIADKIAEIQMTTPEKVADITTNNAARLFGWGG